MRLPNGISTEGVRHVTGRLDPAMKGNRIFRAVHTIKGTSGFMGLEQIVHLTHHGEDVLNVLRNRTTLDLPVAYCRAL